MTKAELIEKLKAEFDYEAREELQNKELELIIAGFESEGLKEENAELQGIIEDMQKQVETSHVAAAKGPKVVMVKVDKESYVINPSGAQLPGKGKYSAEDIAADAKLAAYILKIEGQQILTKPENNA